MNKEYIVLVDTNGQPIGQAEKLASHHADTPLHLAFSCYIFDNQGRVLVTRRAAVKKVWPSVWTNSCCGHPAPGEAMEDAIRRRVTYELGMDVQAIQVVLPRYTYQTPPFRGVIEREFCPVYVARSLSEVQPNPLEVDEYKWLDWPAYAAELNADTNNVYSWWSKDQYKHLQANPLIAQYARAA